ncbi:MAG: 16S rRNA (uracil(1498)-N(3))-methyltransferase [Deltaproteobacteria bacterium]|nr:16S rRNA (uracil(1498)-N(3))-methyltransferase [Deltaproteobacteria bacterium]
MNLLLLDPAELAAGSSTWLSGRRAGHLLDVVKVSPGARVPAGVLGGLMGEAEVRELRGREVRVEVRLDRDPPPPSPVSLLVGMPRPKVLRRLLQAVAAAGVKRLVLLGGWRVERAYFGSPALAPEAILAELRLGLEQGRDTVLPEVRVRRLFKPFVEDELDALLPPGNRLLAHEGASAPLESLAPAPGPAALAIGPEGGFTPYETERLAERGFRCFSLGPRALRVDGAVAFGLGQVEMWLRR